MPNEPGNVTRLGVSVENSFGIQWTDPINSNNFDLDAYVIELSPMSSEYPWSVTNTRSNMACFLFEENDFMLSLPSEVNVSISAMSKCLQHGQTAVITIDLQLNSESDKTTTSTTSNEYTSASDNNSMTSHTV